MKILSLTRPLTTLQLMGLAVAGCAALLSGCPEPNAIGVQQTASIKALCALASNNQPVANALVVVNSTQNRYTGSDGVAVIDNGPVGPQNVTADAPGLHGGPVPVQVTEGTTVSVPITMSPSQ